MELPAGVALDISNDNGAVQVDGGDAGISFPTVTIATDNGPIELRGAQVGAISLRNDNDSVTVENVTAETLNAETDNAPITLNGVQAGAITPAHRERQCAHGERRGGRAGSRHGQRRCDL